MIGSIPVSFGDGADDSADHPDNPNDAVDPTPPPSSEVDWDSMLAQLAGQPYEEGWVTLEEASNAAGISRSTLRSWYRSGQIPSKMVAGRHGPQRLVPLEQVVDRALRSARARRQLEHARSLEAEVAELRRRLDALERHLGLA
jgi:transposase